ncbi:unnamed protein product [Haemonchus placei]|uniref:SLC12 domain-containing protein n=1 Tax=Haemonchus placei TaxID=6290 RepID=A0A0N4VSN4_HAEPC|nr:unnamed protein product [Haemonchus placei]
MDGGILMLIAYLLKQHKVWRGCTLRIFAIGDNDPSKNEEIRKGLQKYIYMLRIDADVFMVNLLDMEVSDEVVEKTAELERQQQTIRSQIRRSKSRESGFTNEAFNNDDTINSRKQLRVYDSVRSFTPVIINITEDAETSFIDNPADGLYTPSEDSCGGDVKLNVYLDVLTENLQRVLFVGGSGKEVVSIDS